LAPPTDFGQLAPGSTFSLGGFDPLQCASAPIRPTASSGAGVEIYSDCPEQVSESGVLYDSIVSSEPVRVYVYHETSGATRRYSVVLTNTDGHGAQVAVGRSGIAGPSAADYTYVGQVALQRFLSSAAGPTLQIPPDGHVVLDPELDQMQVPSQAIVNAIYDLQVSGTVKIAVVSLEPGTDTLAAYPSLNLEPPDAEDRRGTFAPADIDYVVSGYDTAQGGETVDLTDNTVLAVDGVGGQTPTTKPLAGQFGILSHVRIRATSSNGALLGLFLVPRGGDLATSAIIQGSVVDLPQGTQPATVAQGIFVGTFDPRAGEIDFTTSLGGGSSGPVRLVLLPYGAASTTTVSNDALEGGPPGPVEDAAGPPDAGETQDGGSAGDEADGASPVATGGSCDPASDVCADPKAVCATTSDEATLCCIPDGTPSTAGDGSDCCSGAFDLGSGLCGS